MTNRSCVLGFDRAGHLFVGMQVLANMQWLSQETKIVRELASTHSGMEGGVGSGGMGMGMGNRNNNADDDVDETEDHLDLLGEYLNEGGAEEEEEVEEEEELVSRLEFGK